MPPTLIIIGGCNGAGKTTFARHYLPAAGITRFLNADEIARGLSPLDPALAAVRAGRLLLGELKGLMESGESFALESTLSGKSYVRMLRNARERGYRVMLHYLVISSGQQALRRVAMRVKMGGHDVPEEDVLRRFGRSRTHLLADYLPLAHAWWAWDNSSPPPTLLADSKNCSAEDLKRLMEANHLMERPPLSHDDHTRIALEAHRRATEEMMNYFMRMEIEVPDSMLNPEWKQKFADWKRKMAAPCEGR